METEPLKPVSRDFRTGIAVATLGLAYAGIGLLLWLGNPDNALHESGLTVLFWGALAVLAGIGVSAVLPQAIGGLTRSKS
jgi:hypothetical protein